MKPPQAETPGPRAGTKSWMRALRLLTPEDRRRLAYVLFVVVLTALSAALMVASALPFLAVLSDADAVNTMRAVAMLAELLNLSSPYAILIAVGMASLLLIVLTSAMQIWRLFVLERFAANQAYRMSRRLLATYLAKPYAFFLNRHSSDMATAVLSEVGEAVAFFIRPALELVAAAFTISAIAGLMIWLKPDLALAIFVIIGGAFGVTFLLTKGFVKREGEARLAANTQRYRVTNEALDGIKQVKLLGLEARYLAKYEIPAKRMVDAIIAIRIVVQLPRNIIYALASAGVILLCLWLVPREAYLSGQGLSEVVPLLGVFALGTQRLLPELQKLYGASNDMRYGTAAIDKLFSDFGADASAPVASHTPLRLNDRIELSDIGYSYPLAREAGLRDISLTIRKGERVGIVGTTGAGKTTLADIMMGLLTPSQGILSVDGQQVTAEALPAWQQSVGYVPQDIYLTDTSLAENIAFGLDAEEIDATRLHQAAERANLADFVEKDLPHGFETELGERGVRLSGGQRQRIGIARALYRDADFIVFDEATSALDTLTEQEIMVALDAMPQSKTLVLIAHRLSTLRACDRIVVMAKGRIEAIGGWDNLAKESALFREMLQRGTVSPSDAKDG